MHSDTERHQMTHAPLREATGSSSLCGICEGTAQSAGPGRSFVIDYAELRREVSIAAVLELIGWMPVSRKGDQVRGPCPIHRSENTHSRSFSVNLKKNAFQCFGCGKKGNQLDLYMFVTSQTLYQAAKDLTTRQPTAKNSLEASVMRLVGD